MNIPLLTHTKKLSLAVFAVSLLAVLNTHAATVYFVGTNGVSATVNWSDTLNWYAINTTTETTPNNNEANFNYNTGVPGPGIITLNVDNGYAGSGIPQAWGMFFTQTNGYQTVMVQPGVVWTLQAAAGTPGGGNLAIDPAGTNNGGSSGGNSPSIAYTNNVVFTGIGGTFLANTATMRIEGDSAVVTNHYTIWDMSGLGTYIFTNTAGSSQNFYCESGGTRGHVIVYLAHTNIITLNGGQMIIASLSPTTSNSLPVGMYLGMTNYILTGTGTTNFLVGGFGCSNGFLAFNPAFVGGATMPSAYISGTGGSQNAAICNPSGGAYPGIATANFTGGNVTWIGNVLNIGVSGSGVTSANGTLTFDNGLVNFNTVTVGSQSVSGGATAMGTVDIGTNATFEVNTKLTLGATTGTVNAATSGTINVASNGTLQASVITNGGAGSTVNMTNANWIVALNATGTTNMTVANFNSLGTTNIINISFITPVLGGPYPVRFHLISAASLTGASALGLGSLPASYNSTPYAGYLDTTSNPNLVDLVLTSGPSAARSLTWTGTNGGGGTNVFGGNDMDWDVGTTADWQTNGVATFYNQYDLATFPSVSGIDASNVNLTTTLTPYSLTVNATNQYIIGGSGSLSGQMTLTKQGIGTLILDNTTANNFTGGVTISAGILQVGTNDMNGNIPAGSIVDNSVLAFDRTDVSPPVSVSSVISGSGAVVSAGGGVLQLAGANTFTGPAIATNNSTLQGGVADAFGSTSGTVLVANGSTLDPNGAATTRNISVVGNGVGGNGAIVNSGGLIGDSSGGLTPELIVTGNTTLSYPTRWDLGSSTGAILTNNGLGSSLTLNGDGNYFEWRDLKTDPALGNISITSGFLGVAGSTTLGNPSASLNIPSGCGLKFYNDDGFNVSINKQVIINDSGLIQNGAGANTMNGGLIITNSQGSQYCDFEIGGTSLTINSTISGNGILYMELGTSPLTLTGNGSAFNGGVYVSPASGLLTVNGILGCGITNETSTSLAGTGTNTGYLDMFGTFYPGGNGVAGTYTTGGLTLEGPSTLTMDLKSTTTVGAGVNDLIVINGSLAANNNTIYINPIAGTLANGTYTLMTYSGSLSGTFSGAQTTAASRYSLTLSTNTPNVVLLSVVGTPNTLVWNNGAANGNWDVQNSYNWTNLTTHLEDQFYTSDTVTFDDTISSAPNPVTSINVAVNVSPSIMTNSSSANNYTFSGPGAIGGGATIYKTGTSTLKLYTTNTFAGNVIISGGTLQTGNNASLGSSTGTVYVTNGATLDLEYSIGGKPLVLSGAGVGGNGALINSIGNPVYDNPGGPTNVILAGNTTIGGAVRVDFGQLAPGYGFISTGGSNYSLTCVGTSYREFDNVTFDANFGDLDVMTTGGGAIALKGLTTIGNPANKLNIFSNAIVQFYEDGGNTSYNVTVNKNIVEYGGSTLNNSGGSNVILGPMTLGLAAGDNCTNLINGTSLTVSNAISGPGNFIVSSSSPFYLMGTNTYTGDTLINSGTLSLVGNGSISDSAVIALTGTTISASGRVDGTLTLASGQTLEGNGTVSGSLVTSAGSTLIVGTNGTGTLTVTNVVSLAGTTTMGVGTGSNNLLSAANITYGGTLNLNFVPGSLSAGNSFTLFHTPAANYSGSFSSITPATPGAGLQWNTSQLNTTGTIAVQTSLSPVTFGAASISGGNLNLTGTGGTANGTYGLYSTTNLATPIGGWTFVENVTCTPSGTFSISIPYLPSGPPEFYILEQ